MENKLKVNINLDVFLSKYLGSMSKLPKVSKDYPEFINKLKMNFFRINSLKKYEDIGNSKDLDYIYDVSKKLASIDVKDKSNESMNLILDSFNNLREEFDSFEFEDNDLQKILHNRIRLGVESELLSDIEVRLKNSKSIDELDSVLTNIFSDIDRLGDINSKELSAIKNITGMKGSRIPPVQILLNLTQIFPGIFHEFAEKVPECKNILDAISLSNKLKSLVKENFNEDEIKSLKLKEFSETEYPLLMDVIVFDC